MTAIDKAAGNKAAGRDRPNTRRDQGAASPKHAAGAEAPLDYVSPSAGAHAAQHMVNDEATPGWVALPSHAHKAGKDVDGGAG